MRIQIIGAITGHPRKEVEAKFERAEKALAEKGYEVVNPVKLVPATSSWENAMRECLKSLLGVDAVFVMAEWYNSKEAQIEFMVASALQLKEIRE